jgi:hypothetical protein
MLLTLLILTFLNLFQPQAKDGAVMEFVELNYNFGTLEQGSEKVVHEFEFTNEGIAPLVITRATTNCRCLSISTPKRPVRKGEKGKVVATYDPKDVGVFNKAIDLHANIEGGVLTLFVTGEVVKTKN